ncbi:hypothetical protein B4Q13_15305 [Lacticaseibacillus rhamnosus]
MVADTSQSAGNTSLLRFWYFVAMLAFRLCRPSQLAIATVLCISALPGAPAPLAEWWQRLVARIIDGVALGIVFVVINLVVDLMYYAVDPRLRIERAVAH